MKLLHIDPGKMHLQWLRGSSVHIGRVDQWRHFHIHQETILRNLYQKYEASIFGEPG